MTPDGRYVAFTSWAPDLDPRDRNGRLSDVFVHDRKSGETEIVSVSSRGLALPPPPDVGLTGDTCASWSINPSISDDGRYVAFFSLDNTLTGDDGNPFGDVFVHDRKTGSTELVSLTPAEMSFVSHAGNQGLSISGNGRFVAFNASPPLDLQGSPEECPLTPGGPIEVPNPLGFGCPQQIYVRDRVREQTTLVTATATGRLGNDHSWAPSLNRNGRYIAFQSRAQNLTDDAYMPGVCAGTFEQCWHVLLRDLQTEETELISVNRDGDPANSASFTNCCSPNAGRLVSANGRYVLFESWASDLVPAGGGPPGLARGSFVRDRRTERTERVSVTSWGAISRFGSQYSLSRDGHLVGSAFGPVPLTVARDDVTEEEQALAPVVHDRRRGSSVATDGWDPECRNRGTSFGTIGEVGRHLVLATNCNTLVAGDNNDAYDVFVHDRGPPLGVGRVQRAVGSSGTAAGAAAGAASARGGAIAGLHRWADILEARLVYRPYLGDVFVRIDVDRLPALGADADPTFAVAKAGTYVVSFKAASTRYEVRVQPSLMDSGYARFALFRCDDGACIQTASLRGGFGTVGDAVVVSLPFEQIGVTGDDTLTDVHVATGSGSVELGIAHKLDELVIPDATVAQRRKS